MVKARPICRRLEAQAALRAVARAWAKTGKRIAARIAMMAMTTRSSMRVKPPRICWRFTRVSFLRGSQITTAFGRAASKFLLRLRSVAAARLRRRHVQRWVAVKEAHRLEHEA